MASYEPASQNENDPMTLDLKRIMDGQAVPLPVDCIDVQRDAAMQFIPKTKSRMGYIVMTVVFDDQGRVLLVQEAKAGCRGTWYLPAGRLEPGENVVDGARREIAEEAGLDCDIQTVFSLLYPVGHWLRLCFYGTVRGGQLKTLEQQDEESLQAAFYDLHTVFNNGLQLRKKDILPVIQHGHEYHSSLSSVPSHPPLMPVIAGHRHMIHRLVLVAKPGTDDGLHILMNTKDSPRLISAAVAPNDDTLLVTLHVIIKHILDIHESSYPKTKFHGVVGLEHCGTGQGADGMCITTLVSVSSSDEPSLPPVRNSSYAWVPLRDPVCSLGLRKALDGSIVKIVCETEENE